MLWPQAQRTARRASTVAPFPGASGEVAISFHVAYFGFNRVTRTKLGDQFGYQAVPGSADRHASPVLPWPRSTTTSSWRCSVRISKCSSAGRRVVAVERIARKAAPADHEALAQRGGHADLAAKLISNQRLALGDTVDLWLMQGADLVVRLGCWCRTCETRASLAVMRSCSFPSGMSSFWCRRLHKIRPV